jgi:hypothetical protein
MSTERFNVNTLLSTLILGLCGWSLLELNAQGKAQAAYAVQAAGQAIELAELRVRMQRNDTAIQELRFEIAKITPR